MPSTTPDLANDILSLNRTTERMILSSFQFTTRKNKKTIEIDMIHGIDHLMELVKNAQPSD